MSHEAVPQTRRQNPQTGRAGHLGQAAHDEAPVPAGVEDRQDSAAPARAGGAPKGLLQQMEELMAALNADLLQLDADLQSSTDRTPPTTPPAQGDTAQGETTQGDTAQSDTAQGGTAQGDTAQSGTAQSDTAQGGTAQGGTAQGDTRHDTATHGSTTAGGDGPSHRSA
ncbi:hypothetical protein ACIA6C_27530 [Streptomyces sp. NPDC051578]|uniref:hypothetical protein n=1 Tax=Streptomyces sp. NPDC051578 TaxID=3365662 RepID=UPI0037B73CE1